MRSGRSRPPHFLIRSGGLRPRGPPHAFARGAPTPRSASAGAPVARLELVKRVLVLGGSRAPHQIRGASPPRPPHAFARGTPTPRSASAGAPVARLELVKRVLVLGGSRAPHQIR